ncbi:MAG: outer membrane lipoprotein-sorting protein [Parachlamydiales bacterium]|nr:outer membrane lipoprotein-sorting protein [Parachlamydiales bacterium]
MRISKKFFLLFLPWILIAQDIETIIDKIDKLFRSDFSHGNISMSIHTPNWERTLDLEVWTKGMEETFIVIQEPKKDRGTATLRKKNEMWNYFPKIDKVIKVPPSMMMSAWMGSDFTNDDLVREVSLLQDYKASYLDKEPVSEGFVWISLKPKQQTVTVWREIRLLVDKATHIPHQQIYYDEHGEKIRILFLREIKELGGKMIPTVLEMIPLHKKNHKTIVRYREMTFNKSLDPGIFSLRNLQKKR